MKINFQLNNRLSDLFICCYLIGFLFLRFQIENHFNGNYMVSIAFGILTLVFLWALIKSKILNPDYFGLLKKKENRASRKMAARKTKRKTTP